jgi:hypothetical protein
MKENYLVSLTNFDERDPITSFINLDDHLAAFFKQERKTNYKSGIVDPLGVFDFPPNLHQSIK